MARTIRRLLLPRLLLRRLRPTLLLPLLLLCWLCLRMRLLLLPLLFLLLLLLLPLLFLVLLLLLLLRGLIRGLRQQHGSSLLRAKREQQVPQPLQGTAVLLLLLLLPQHVKGLGERLRGRSGSARQIVPGLAAKVRVGQFSGGGMALTAKEGRLGGPRPPTHHHRRHHQVKLI